MSDTPLSAVTKTCDGGSKSEN